MKNICNKCGRQISEGVVRCNHCGRTAKNDMPLQNTEIIDETKDDTYVCLNTSSANDVIDGDFYATYALVFAICGFVTASLFSFIAFYFIYRATKLGTQKRNFVIASGIISVLSIIFTIIFVLPKF